jgi:hypothetical protein
MIKVNGIHEGGVISFDSKAQSLITNPTITILIVFGAEHQPYNLALG